MLELRIAHLYPEQMNIYGDRGNILALVRRCQWRGMGVRMTEVGVGTPMDPAEFDLYFIGGGQDAQQEQIGSDLFKIKAPLLKEAVANGAVFLTICGGYQLLGHYYKPHNGPEIPGLSLMDTYTVAGNRRLIGNVAIRRGNERIVGFENHSGKTYLGKDVQPLGTVEEGFGNNGEDGMEGGVYGNLYGTYLHGPLLPKNPHLTDELIERALSRRYSQQEIETAMKTVSLDMGLEKKALDSAYKLCQLDAKLRQENRFSRFMQSLKASR